MIFVSLLAFLAAAAGSGVPARPNIVFIMADDLDTGYKFDHLSVMPTLKHYWADNGIMFINHVAALPVCGPSRSSLLAGRYPHNTGYYSNADVESVQNWRQEENNTFGAWASAAGYHTAFLGKYVNGMNGGPFRPHGFDDVPSGWSRWGGFISGVKTYNMYNSSIYDVKTVDGEMGPVEYTNMEGTHQADYLGKLIAGEAKAAVAAGKPFLVHSTPVMVHWATCQGPCAAGSTACYGPDDPHWEWQLPKWGGKGTLSFPCSPCPTQRHAHTYDSLTAPHTPAWNRTASGIIPERMATQYPFLSAQQAHREDICFRNRTSSMSDLDDMLLEAIEGVQALGDDVYNNTIFIFSSDNGFHLGEHRMPFGKGEPYSTDVMLPLYVFGPGVSRGQVRHHPTNHMDVTATLVDLTGATPVGEPLDGKSFKDVLGDDFTPVSAWRTWQYSEYFGETNTWQAFRTLANATELDGLNPYAPPASIHQSTMSLAVHRWCTNQTEVFDLERDPWQMNNTYHNGGPAVEDIIAKMITLGSCKGDSCRDPTPAAAPAPLPCHATHKGK